MQKNILLFSVPIKKELDNGKTITYKLKFIDSLRSMPTSHLSLLDSLSEIQNKNVEIKIANRSVI